MISVLYVDDEAALLDLARLYLGKDTAIQVDTALSATMALQKMAKQAYDTVISDYFLPDMDGLQLLRSLKTAGNSTPFILFTGRGREEVVIDALNYGAAFYLQKGGDPRAQFAELRHMVIQVVQQQRAQAALRESESLFRTLVNTMLDAILILDWDGQIRFANASAFRLMDAEPETMPEDLNIVEFLAPESRDTAFQDLALVRAGKGGFLREYRVRSLRGEEKWVEGLGTRILFGGKEGDFVCLRDTTERKRAEAALRASEERFREVYQNANDAIVLNVLTPEGRPGRFIEVNDFTCNRLLYSREELLAMTPEDLGLDLGNEENEQWYQDLLAHRPVMFETKLRTKSGIWIPVEINAHVCALDGKEVIITVARDITERKINQEVEKRAFEQIERNIDQFAILGDHVRNPLAVIIGLADMEGSPHAQKIIEQARIIDQIITRLDMQWIESEKVREFVRRHYREDEKLVAVPQIPLVQASSKDLSHQSEGFNV
jgi:PAS domain S-box-containing protein